VNEVALGQAFAVI